MRPSGSKFLFVDANLENVSRITLTPLCPSVSRFTSRVKNRCQQRLRRFLMSTGARLCFFEFYLGRPIQIDRVSFVCVDVNFQFDFVVRSQPSTRLGIVSRGNVFLGETLKDCL